MKSLLFRTYGSNTTVYVYDVETNSYRGSLGIHHSGDNVCMCSEDYSITKEEAQEWIENTISTIIEQINDDIEKDSINKLRNILEKVCDRYTK